jgi:uncharacterized Zn finger protein
MTKPFNNSPSGGEHIKTDEDADVRYSRSRKGISSSIKQEYPKRYNFTISDQTRKNKLEFRLLASHKNNQEDEIANLPLGPTL